MSDQAPPPTAPPGDAALLVNALDTGLAVLGADRRVGWANPAFRQWCEGEPAGLDVLAALGGAEVRGADGLPWARVQAGNAAAVLLRLPSGRHIDLRLIPLSEPELTLARCRDVTEMVNSRQKLEALHQAGRELAALAPDQLADMSAEERVELLKLNLRRIVHDLLRYDVIEIRLLNRKSGILEQLLAEGMTHAAESRVLSASPTGNGVTGLVAATGRSYLCPDTARDPHYLEGMAGGRSSVTVPLIVQEQVIGTMNIESPQLNSFTPEDLQFAELFSREVAQALHTLELLSAQRACSVSQSIDAVNREIALPVDDILSAATGLLARQPADAPDADAIKRIIGAARSVKQSVQSVSESFVPTAAEGDQQPSRLRGLRVLFADADERTRRSAHGMLDRFGCLVETARTAAEALDLAKATPYDVILTDIRLPDQNGYDAYLKFRAARPEARVVFMTGFGYDSTHSIVNARRDGLRFVIYKPLRPDQVLDALLSPDKPALVPHRAEAQPEVIQAS